MIELIQKIVDAGLLLEVIDGKLKLFAGDKTVDKEILAEIKANKAAITKYLTEKNVGQPASGTIPKAPTMEEYPLSAVQKRMWVASQVQAASLAYNMPATIEITNAVDFENFEKAINATIERHEILRTVFQQDVSGEVYQKVLPTKALCFRLGYMDFRGHPDIAKAIKQYLAQANERPFDLAQGPLLKAALLHIASDKYVFYYNMHHIIADGWSLEVLAKDTLAYYEHFTQSVPIALPELPIQYKDYALWHAGQSGVQHTQHRQFFETYLQGELPVLQLVSQKARPRVKSYNGKTLKTSLPTATAEKLRNLCVANQGSLFVGLYAIWNILLHKYSGQQDILMGTPVAGRGHQDLANQIGCYINTLLLRNQIDYNETFVDKFQRLKSMLLAVFEHQNYPFDLLAEDLGLKNDASRSLGFDVLIVLQNAPKRDTVALSSQDEAKVLDSGSAKVKFDIEMVFVDDGAGLSLSLSYNTDVYEHSLMRQMLGHYIELTKAIIAKPKSKICDYNVLTAEERSLILHSFNDTITKCPTEDTIVSLFECQVSATPDAVAVTTGQVTLTYAQLNEKANQLGHFLREQHAIKPDDIVGVTLPRNEGLIIAIYGVLKAGGAYLPIDPSNPESRKAYIKKDAGCNVVINPEFMRGFEHRADQYPIHNPKQVANSRSLAYVIYTSGSTGNPKGVMVEHYALVNRLFWMQKAYPLAPQDTIMQKTTYSFDVSVWELFWWGWYGANVFLLEPGGEKEPAKIAESIAKHKVSVMHFVPAMLSPFLAYLKEFPDEKYRLKSLKQIFASGEALTKHLRDTFLETLPGVSLMNLYGPTEACIDVTFYDCAQERDDLAIPIGKPIDNTQLYILDAHNSLVPIGVKGKLYIAGRGLARGYLNKDKLTAAKFVENPFVTGTRMYDTGDRAAWLPDGNIAFLGRGDSQVKIRGYRIELGEIEHHLRDMPAISDAVVLDRAASSGANALVAYIVSKEPVSLEMLRQWMIDKVPHYMVPSAFINVDELPLTASGKTDKKRLLAMNADQVASQSKYQAPNNKAEKVLVEVYQEVLKRDKIGINESFYGLGGDSIKSIQMVSRLKQKGYALTVEQVLKNPVIEDLAKLLVSVENVASQTMVSGQVVLGPAQQYLFEQFEKPSHYNQSVILKSKNPIQLTYLKDSMAKVVAHHDALRIVFTEHDGKLVQYNNPIRVESEPELVSYDLTSQENQLAQMDTLAQGLQVSFTLDKGPLVKVGHFKLDDGERLAIFIHHLVIDGVSWRILLEDLINLYTNAVAGQPLNLPLKTDAYQQWNAALLEYATQVNATEEGSYWQAVCAQNLPPLYETIKRGNDTKVQRREVFALNKQTTEKLQTQFHNVYNTAINDVLLTGLALAVESVFGQSQMMIKMEGHGRDALNLGLDIGRTIGWFTAIYPFLLDISGTQGTTECLVQVKESLRKIPNKGIGYGVLKYLNEDYSSLDFTPSVVFNYLGILDGAGGANTQAEFQLSSEKIGQNIAEANEENSVLHISGSIVAGQLQLSITYHTLAFSPEVVQQLAHAYQEHLKKLIDEVTTIDNTYKTPHDLSYKGLSVASLKAINPKEDIEDIYELSPLQQGIYYHWLSDVQSTMYFEQLSYRLYIENIDIDTIQQGYQQIVDRHAVLRTSFTNSLAEVPLQIVRKGVKSDFRYKPLFEVLSERDIPTYVSNHKITDRKEGFDLSADTSMRLTVIALGQERYEFIWSHHHILMDGWCISILIRDFNLLLNGISTSKPVTLPKPQPYSKYLEWLGEKKQRASEQYWEQYLRGYTDVATIPFAKFQGQAQSFQAGTAGFIIDEGLIEKLQALCSRHNITQNMFMQAAWGFLLSKYNNTNDVVFGAVVSGRPAEIEGIEETVGLFINTIPVRVTYTPGQTPSDLFETVKEAAITGNVHHYLNLAKVQALSEPGAGLINHIMVFENFPIQEVVADQAKLDEGVAIKMTVESIEVFEQTNYSFNLLVTPSAKALRVDFKYNAHQFEPQEVERVANHLQYVIEAFIDDEGQALEAVEYFSETEKQQVFSSFNNNATDYGENNTVLSLFRNQVEANPTGIAISFADKQLSFKVLDERSDQFAAYLYQQYQVSEDSLVGLQINRSEWMLIAILGILKAGAAYVPIDTEHPQERVDFILEDSGCQLCVTAKTIAQFSSVQDDYAQQYRQPDVKPTQLAYVIYTSGSTGKPKGVLNAHAALYNRLMWMKNGLEIDRKDKILQKTPYTFDVSVWELLMPLVTGCQLTVAEPGGHKDPAYLKNIIEEKGITILHFVPAMLGVFLESIQLNTGHQLRHVVCSGESLPSAMVEVFKEMYPKTHIHNYYGPTEAAIDVTAIDLTTVDTAKEGVPIGVPVPNTNIYIVDNQMALQPVGVPGELLIGGVQVAIGYQNRSALNAEKFIESPFKDGERIYKTGDLAKWLPNGQITYLGRVDHQVKVKGNRIELGEVEKAIVATGLVENAVVATAGHEVTNKQLVGYLVPKPGYSQPEFISMMQQKLPDYMIPSIWVPMDALPLTINGKVNRKALPPPNAEALSNQEYTSPRSEMEKQLAGIWEAVLGRPKVGIHDDFFNHGGDSILLIRLIGKINKTFTVSLNINQIYESSTIAKIAALIKEGKEQAQEEWEQKKEISHQIDRLKDAVINAIPDSENIADVYPMSDIQKGMVLLSVLDPKSALYHDQFVFHVPTVNLSAFKQALGLMVREHATLRTRFDMESYQQEVQIVEKEVPIEVHDVDIRDMGAAAQEEYVSTYMAQERQKPFDTQKAPLWRVSILNISASTDIFILQFHHAILDGWSIATLNTSLFQTYQAIEKGQQNAPEPLKCSNRDAIVAELYERENKQNIQFWKEALAGYKRLDIVTNTPANERFAFRYEASLRNRLEEKCQADGLTIKDVVYGAFVYVLKNLGCETDFIVGVVANNRPLTEDGDKLLGCFLNTLPVRNQLENADEGTWSMYFKQVAAQLKTFLSRDRITLLKISEITNEPNEQVSPFFDVLFNYIDFHVYNELALEDNNAYKKAQEERLNIDAFEATNTALDLDVNVSSGGLSMIYTVKKELKAAVSLAQIHRNVDRVITQFIEGGDTLVGHTEFVSAEEKEQLLAFNDTLQMYEGETIISLIHQQAIQYPQRTALVDKAGEITYERLEEVTSCLAQLLISRYSIEQGDHIGLMVKRSNKAIIGMLGILKAGAAYVPIDLGYPEERKTYIIEDSQCKLIIDETFMDEALSALSRYDKAHEQTISAASLAYIIYTSGSTGKPKGVMINHNALKVYAMGFKNYFTLTPEDSIMQQASLSFDTSVEEIFPMLASGGKVVVHEDKNDFDALLKLCEAQQITLLSTNPYVLQYLNEVYEEYSFNLRALISGGDVLKPAYIDKIWKKVSVYNTYGPTESTVCATYHEVTTLNQVVAIGKPIANRQVYILSPGTNQLTPIGIVGEICIAGEGLAMGYHNNTHLTNQKFVANPFVKDTRMYRTGDLGRWLPDGSIEFIGRKDNQVSIRGYRIELGEVEAAMLKNEYVEDALALVSNEDKPTQSLYAYLIPKTGYSRDEMQMSLKKQLPDYMIPHVFIELESFPLTVNGKLDKKALLAENPQQSKPIAYKAPTTDIETRLLNIWVQILDRKDIGINNNFFEIGGNSLSVVSLRRAIEKEFGIALDIVVFFTNTTIESIAQLLSKEEPDPVKKTEEYKTLEF